MFFECSAAEQVTSENEENEEEDEKDEQDEETKGMHSCRFI